MAKIKDGALLGKFGNLVGCKLRDTYYVRQAPQRTTPRTEGELRSENNFRVIMAWLKPINLFVKQGFKNPKMTGLNAAHSCLSKEALIKDGMNSYVDPVLAKVSSGNLGMPQNLQAELVGELQLVFTWDSTLVENSSPRDRIMMLAYNDEKAIARYELNGAKRFTGEDVLDLPAGVAGTFHLYGAFVSEDGARQSNSKYLGTIEI